MNVKRPHLLAATSGLCLAIAACGGSSTEDNPPLTPEGMHYGYVVSKPTVVLPAPHASTEYGLDLGTASSSGGATSSKLDGKLENKLGNALQVLTGFFDVQGTVDEAVATGNIILLLDFQTKDFTTASASGLSVKFGAMPNPPACTSPTDTTCGHHLTGNAMFQIAANSPSDTELTGKIAGGTFTGGPGEVSLQLAIGSTQAIKLDLIHARAQATNISATGMTVIIGGLLTVQELKTTVGTALESSVAMLIASGCTVTATPFSCTCTGSAKTIMDIADGTTGTAPDCKLSVDELLGNPVIAPLLVPDSCSKDSCTMADALSLGVKAEAVKATFTF